MSPRSKRNEYEIIVLEINFTIYYIDLMHTCFSNLQFKIWVRTLLTLLNFLDPLQIIYPRWVTEDDTELIIKIIIELNIYQSNTSLSILLTL